MPQKNETIEDVKKDRDFYRNALVMVRNKIWSKDIPSPATPEYIEWHAACTDFMAMIDLALENKG